MRHDYLYDNTFTGVNNKPFYDNLPRSLSIGESTSVGSVVFTLSVIDHDNDTLFYQVDYEPTSSGTAFSFDTTSKI